MGSNNKAVSVTGEPTKAQPWDEIPTPQQSAQWGARSSITWELKS